MLSGKIDKRNKMIVAIECRQKFYTPLAALSQHKRIYGAGSYVAIVAVAGNIDRIRQRAAVEQEIGRASCRERV